MPSKKNKNDEEPLKPLSHYVKDRLELTKQLFSCLKSKQIKSRLPKNIETKNMQTIQQLVLDEILGISSKRLLSIINNTPCPADTESDSDIEHISLSEISSDENDDMMIVEPQAAAKEKTTDKPGETSKANSADPKPKTMLELIELEARARAIRSQLALEPVTKIELDDSEDEEIPEESPVTGPVRSNPPQSRNNSASSSKKSTEKSRTDASKSSSEKQKKTTEPPKKSAENSKKPVEPPKKPAEPPKKSSDISKKSTENSKKTPEATKKSSVEAPSKSPQRNERTRKSTSPPPNPPPSKRTVVFKKTGDSSELIVISKQVPSAPPVKLKRNFSKTTSETSIASTSEPPKAIEEPETKQEMTESRSSSPDIITMEQNIATFFISDSEDESEPPTKKKSPQKQSKEAAKAVEEALKVCEKENVNDSEPTSQVESKQTSPKSSQENIPNEEEEIEAGEIIGDESPSGGADTLENPDNKKLVESDESAHEDDDENVVNLMSDTEIDLNANSDREDDEKEEQEEKKPAEAEEKSKTETEKNISVEENVQVEKPAPEEDNCDDDVVEILHSDDEDLEMGEKPSESEKNADESENWQQRYLRSSAVKSVLKTTKLASKVRGKLAATKKSKASEKQKESKKKIEKQKEITERISKLEEGSIEQFQVIKETSNSGD